MSKNIFSDLQDRKQELIETAKTARANGWIDEAREQEIIDKINNDTLTLGVIGQMKCGKSTFLNAFVFGDTILPSATTPMTAALSVITYGEEQKLVAEFYTKDEWAEQEMQASRSLDEVRGNEAEESKIKSAKELMSKASKLPGSVSLFLGKTQEDSFDNLIDYVGADGKYVSITKAVTIYYPHEYLKGVEIVDTPGFNDPIVSREERTKEFLKRADVVLLMLYAGRAFDATDRAILFKNVRECGIGKVLIGVNKYDIPYANGETEGEIISNIKEQIRKACTEAGDDSMTELVTERDPILLSAGMSLLSQLPMEKIQKSEELSHAWDRSCDTFEISTQKEMASKSLIQRLTDAIQEVIERDKMEVLLRKPASAIKAAADKKKAELEGQHREILSRIENLQKPDEELEEKKAHLERAEKRVVKKLDSLGEDIDSSFKALIRKGKTDMEDAIDSAYAKMGRIVDGMGRMQNAGDIIPRLEAEENKLAQRTLKRAFEHICQDAKRGLTRNVNDFCLEVEDVLLKYVEDYDTQDFIKSVNNKISYDIETRNLFSTQSDNSSESSSSNEETFLGFVGGLLATPFVAYFGMIDGVINWATNNSEAKSQLHSAIESRRSSFEVEPFLERLYERKEEVISSTKRLIFDELLTPLKAQIDDILNNVKDKAKALEEARGKEAELKQALELFSEQYNKIYKG